MNQAKICTKCNIEKELTEFNKHKGGKFGVNSKCKSCIKQWRQDNKEYLAKYFKQHHQTNKIKIGDYQKQYRQDNQERATEYRKHYYQNNKEQMLEQQKQYRQDNAAQIAEYKKQYYQTSNGKAALKVSRQNRRARIKNAEGKHSTKDILNLFGLQSGVCPYCRTRIYKTGENKYHSDHIVPLSKGGANDISNIQLLCPKCNLAKKDKLPNDYAAEHGKLF